MHAVHESMKTQEDEIYHKYLCHCVLMIQKTWRGYFVRKEVRPRLVREFMAIRMLTAWVQGWKIRRIMGAAREVINIKREMAEIGFEMRRTLGISNHQT